jgi:hypothetical protein
MRARVVATKITLGDLKPGDLFSYSDGTNWNSAMAGDAPPQALVCTNTTDAAALREDTLYVYRLTIIKESVDKDGTKVQQRDAHMSAVLDPNAPPGVVKGR